MKKTSMPREMLVETIESLARRFSIDKKMENATAEERGKVYDIGLESLSVWDTISPEAQSMFAGYAALTYTSTVIKNRYSVPGDVPNDEYQQFIDAVTFGEHSLTLAMAVPRLAPVLSHMWTLSDFMQFANAMKSRAIILELQSIVGPEAMEVLGSILDDR